MDKEYGTATNSSLMSAHEWLHRISVIVDPLVLMHIRRKETVAGGMNIVGSEQGQRLEKTKANSPESGSMSILICRRMQLNCCLVDCI